MRRKLLLSVVILISLILYCLLYYEINFNENYNVIEIYSKYIGYIGIVFWVCFILYSIDTNKPTSISLLYLIPMAILLIQVPLFQMLIRTISMTTAVQIISIFNIIQTIIIIFILLIDYRFKKKPTLVVLVIYYVCIILYYLLSSIGYMKIMFDLFYIIVILRDILLLIFLIIEIRSHTKNNHESVTL